MKETEKKQTHFLRIAMMVLTTILIVLFFMIMSMVGKIHPNGELSIRSHAASN